MKLIMFFGLLTLLFSKAYSDTRGFDKFNEYEVSKDDKSQYIAIHPDDLNRYFVPELVGPDYASPKDRQWIHKAWDGEPITISKNGTNIELLPIKVSLKKNGKAEKTVLPIHCHPLQTFAYMIKGKLELVTMDDEGKSKSKLFHVDGADKPPVVIVESYNQWHYGIIHEEVELLTFWVVKEGETKPLDNHLTIPHPAYYVYNDKGLVKRSISKPKSFPDVDCVPPKAQQKNLLAKNSGTDNNLLKDVSASGSGELKWMNKPKKISYAKDTLLVRSEAKTDFFIDPSNGKPSASAPVLYKEIRGDFVATALVTPDLSNMWNAGSLMMIIDSENWIKFAFENSDATGNSIVSVVTRGVSDDANGVRLEEQETIWLRLIRKGDIYSMLWSKDGKHYYLARLSKMPSAKMVKIGIESQSPLDNEAVHKFHHFSVVHRTVDDVRKGI